MEPLTVLSAIVFLAGGFLLWCLFGFCRACINQSRFEAYFLRLLLKSRGMLVPFRKQLAGAAKEHRSHKVASGLIISAILIVPKLVAQQDRSNTQDTSAQPSPAQVPDPVWQYGGF